MYWNYFPKAAPRPKAKPGKERKKFGETWWGKKWVEVLSEFEHDQRMSRGRAYARAERVKNFKLAEGGITARVQGSMGIYKINITFKKFSSKKWDAILQKLSGTPILLSGLLNNEMPEKIEEMTGHSFVPDSFESECSCPDYANPCKHIAAVFYTLADEIDYDPMILFKLKGMGKEQLLSRLGVVDNASTEAGSEPVKAAIKKQNAQDKAIKAGKSAAKKRHAQRKTGKAGKMKNNRTGKRQAK